jgi:hypothetical protein
MMSAEECRAYSAIWLARGKNQNISFKRAMTFLDLARNARKHSLMAPVACPKSPVVVYETASGGWRSTNRMHRSGRHGMGREGRV